MNRYTRTLLWVGSILNVVFLWVMPIYVTMDGPSHLYNAYIFNDLLYGDGFYSDYFIINAAIYPNWTGSILLAILVAVFPALLAEKIWLTLLMVAFMYTSYLVIKRLAAQNILVAMGILFITQNYFFVLGFYNYILGIALLNLVIYKSLGPRKESPWKEAIEWIILSLLVFFTHPVSFLLALAYIFSKELISLLLSKDKTNYIKNLLQYGLYWTPSLILFAIYFLNSETSGEDSIFEFNVSVTSLIRLFGLRYMQSYGGVEIIIYGLFGVFIFSSLVFHYKSWLNTKWLIRNGGLIALWLSCIFIYFFVNDVFAGGSFFARRITLILYLTTIFIIATFSLDSRYRTGLGIFSMILLLFLLAVRFPIQWRNSKITETYLECAEAIPKGSVIMPLEVSPRILEKEEVRVYGPYTFQHISGYLAVKSQLLSVDNYEARTTYFPIKWREGQNPYDYIKYEDPADKWTFAFLSLEDYINKTGNKIDFVPVLGDSTRTELFESIMGEHELVEESDVHSLYRLTY
jgi:hypothetical protein